MKWLILSITIFAFIPSGTAWDYEAVEKAMENKRSQAQEPITSNRTMDPGMTERSGLGSQQTAGVESEKSAVGEYVDDALMTATVKAGLAKDPGASALAIGVETTQGTVQLSGAVDSAEEKMIAESIARSVDGVKEVDNRIAVQ